MSEQYPDLGITQNQDGDYWDVVIPDLDFDTSYALQAGWMYSDKSLGVSELSDRFNFTTDAEPAILAPHFISTDVYAINSILYIKWDGLDSSLAAYDAAKLKQVNVWIKGGDFGEAFKQIGQVFTKAQTLQINATKKSTYCIKLQAESKQGNFSSFSSEFCTTLLKQPQAVTSLQGRWVKDDLTSKTDALMMTFNFDPAYSDGSNSNIDADYFLITLTANSKSRTFWSPVNKSSTSQSFFLTAVDNKASFGLFASQFEVFILVRDTFGQVSTLVNAQTLTYETPLDTPIITATAGTLSYSVAYNNQTAKPFDNIYIYEDSGSGYSQVAQANSNPIVVPATNTLQRYVKAKFYDSNGGSTLFSNIVTVTPLAVVTADTYGPPNVASVTVVGSLDLDGVIGFNGHATISWASVTGSGIRGYRIRWRQVATPPTAYSYVDSPGTGTAYHLLGLGVGLEYEFAVATYDEYNNTSTEYVAGNNITITGTPYIAGTVDVAGYFRSKANITDADSTAFKFGYGVDTGKRGLVFNANNYWYIDSNQSASLKVGGATTNFIRWDGSDFLIDGNISARKGTFSGNVTIAPGGSLQSFITPPTVFSISAVTYTASTATYTTTANHGYIVGDDILISGLLPEGYNGKFRITAQTLTTFTVTNTTNAAVTDAIGSVIIITGAGFVLNKDGLAFNSSITRDITTINSETGLFTTKSANIGGWDVDATTISKNGLSLNSTGKIIANSGAYYIGIEPKSATVNDIVLWAGQSATGGTTTSGANFRVTAGGTLYATGAVIQGTITLTNGSGLSDLINSKANIYRAGTQPSGTAYNNGDLWVDTANNNKVYQWNTASTLWVVVQDSAAALAAAATADGKADVASGKAQKFDTATGNLITGLTLNNNTASIYSGKTTYIDDTTTGWYLGWNSVGGGALTPAIAIGGPTTYLKYSTQDGVQVKGNIQATGGSFEGNVTAGNGAITIGTGGISAAGFSINTLGAATFTSGTFSGNITSSANIAATGTITGGFISGSTITGGLIQTSSSSSDRRIVIDSAGSKDAILFKGISSDGVTADGKITVGFGLTENSSISSQDGTVFSSSYPSLTVSAPVVATSGSFAFPAKIAMSNSSAGGIIEINATWTRMKGYVELLNGFAYGTQAVRMISAGTLAPTSDIGKEGSVYFQIG